MSIVTARQVASAIESVLRGSETKRGTSPASPQDTAAPKTSKPCRPLAEGILATVPGHENTLAAGTEALVGLVTAAVASITLVVPQEQTA